MKTLLIGQAPGPNTDPKMPLFPLPKTSAGGRLQALMGVSRGVYLREFVRVNLLQEFPGQHKRDDKFPVAKARVAAQAMWPLIQGRTIVFVGRNVANAFGFSSLPFHEWCDVTDISRAGMVDSRVAIIPHTSGRNHWYNDPEHVEEARAFWRAHLLGFAAGPLFLRPEAANLGSTLEMEPVGA